MQRPPKKRISAEILNMIDKSTREAKVPSRSGELAGDLGRKRESQDATSVASKPRQDASRIVPKQLFSDDVPHRLEHYVPTYKFDADHFKPISEYTPRRRR